METPAPFDGPHPFPPAVRREALLRGPLILTALSRGLSIPFYLFCAYASSRELWRILPRFRFYSQTYVADKILLAVAMWIFLLLSVLLAWLFFTRRRAFRPLMIYFGCLFLLLLMGIVLHTKHFPTPHRSSSANSPWLWWVAAGLLTFMLSGFLWPFYYAFSPRVKRVFTR